MPEQNNSTALPAFHGSDIEKISEYFDIPKERIVKFGANVNPLGLSSSLKRAIAEHLDLVSDYPDRDYTSLRTVIAQYCNVSPEHVVTGNGSTELISLLISQRRATHAVIVGPTYSEYERGLSLTGTVISEYCLSETDDFRFDTGRFLEEIPSDTDFLILCNPNNPTSSAIPTDELEQLLSACQERNIFVMIDETYVEFAPDLRAISAMPLTERFDNLFVIRGVSKFYAAPGLRLGYGVTGNKAYLDTLKQRQNPWSLNSIAAFAGEYMLQDHVFYEQTRSLILMERERMMRELSAFRYAKTYPAYANFILVKIQKDGLRARDVFLHAIRQGLMIRDCSSFESLSGEYIRFCIMHPEDNDRLLTCLGELLR